MKLKIREHLAIIGKTQTGKTTLAKELFKNLNYSAIFVDYEGRMNIPKAKNINMNSRLNSSSFEGQKYVYTPDVESDLKGEVRNLFKILKRMNKVIYVFADEIPEYGSFRKNGFDIYAQRGLKYGVHLVSISQRPQHLSNTILSQTEQFVFFQTNYEEKYMKDYNLPYREVSKLQYNYHFLVYDHADGILTETPLMLDI